MPVNSTYTIETRPSNTINILDIKIYNDEEDMPADDNDWEQCLWVLNL
jgi:hypothetical protein